MTDSKSKIVAIIGATGAVGQQLLSILDERKFPVDELRLFASARSENREIKFQNKMIKCQKLAPGCFKGVDVAFFDASDEVSKVWVPEAAGAGAWVIDNSATFRLESDIPLIVPEVNSERIRNQIREYEKSRSARKRIFSGPNCSTVQLVLALKPLKDLCGLKRVVVSTYQSTSGAGKAAMEELSQQTLRFLENQNDAGSSISRVFPHPIAFNCIPQIGGFKGDGYTSEELKLIHETRKILEMPDLKITATAIRVPTFFSHSESVNVECKTTFQIKDVQKALGSQSGLKLTDDPEKSEYPMGRSAAGRDWVYIGRIRKDESVQNGLNFWVVSDNLRKGAALNAIQLAETLLQYLD